MAKVPLTEGRHTKAENQMLAPNLHIIGLAGLKRSSKDTFAKCLDDQASTRGIDVHMIAFANPLRSAVRILYQLSDRDWFGDALKDTPHPMWRISPRQMLINVGQAMRGVDPDHWVKLLCRDVELIESNLEGPTLVVVTDVRQRNEADALRVLGGRIAVVKRPGITWDGHVTEQLAGECVYPFDYTVRNDSTIAHLGVAAREILDRLYGREA